MATNAKVGQIYVCRFGYSMVLYDFYKVTEVKAASVRVQKLKKQYLGNVNSWHCPVRPTSEIEEEKTFRLCKKSDCIKVYGGHLWFDDYGIYDPAKEYAEDHMD